MESKPIWLKNTATPEDKKNPPLPPKIIQELMSHKENKIGWRTPRVEEQTLPLWPGTAEVALGFVTKYDEGFKASKGLRASINNGKKLIPFSTYNKPSNLGTYKLTFTKCKEIII